MYIYIYCMYTYINICTHSHRSLMYKTDNDGRTLDETEKHLARPTPFFPGARVVTHTFFDLPDPQPTQMQ